MIKAKDGCDFLGHSRIHVMESEFTLCGKLLDSDLKHDAADESEICKTCLKIARKSGLIEEVPDHLQAMPKGYRIMEEGEEITEGSLYWNNGEGPWIKEKERGLWVGRPVETFHVPICCPVDNQNTEETTDNADRGEQVIAKSVQDPIKAKLHEYECRAKAAEDEVVELKEERDELCKANDDLHRSRGSYMMATKGHTLENITTIMQAAPTAEDLEGYELRVSTERPHQAHDNSAVEIVEGDRWTITIIRTPIVEYIPTEEITDELVEKHGRIPCEAQAGDCTGWNAGTLIFVRESTMTFRYDVLVDGGRRLFTQCRIKRSTIESLRGAK